MTGERLKFENGLDLGTEPMEATTHIRHAGRNPDPGAERELDHLPTL